MARNRKSFKEQLGEENVETFLSACESNELDRDSLKSLARLISPKVGGQFEQFIENGKYDGRRAANYLLEFWNQDDHTEGCEMNAWQLRELLQDKDVALHNVANKIRVDGGGQNNVQHIIANIEEMFGEEDGVILEKLRDILGEINFNQGNSESKTMNESIKIINDHFKNLDRYMKNNYHLGFIKEDIEEAALSCFNLTNIENYIFDDQADDLELVRAQEQLNTIQEIRKRFAIMIIVANHARGKNKPKEKRKKKIEKTLLLLEEDMANYQTIFENEKNRIQQQKEREEEKQRMQQEIEEEKRHGRKQLQEKEEEKHKIEQEKHRMEQKLHKEMELRKKEQRENEKLKHRMEQEKQHMQSLQRSPTGGNRKCCGWGEKLIQKFKSMKCWQKFLIIFVPAVILLTVITLCSVLIPHSSEFLLIGGEDDVGNNLDNVEVYGSGLTLPSLPNLPLPLNAPIAEMTESGAVYVAGGSTSKTFMLSSLTSSKWEEMEARMPRPVYYAASVVVRDIILVLGGYGGDDKSDVIQLLDTSNSLPTWELLKQSKLYEPLEWHSAAVFEGQVFIVTYTGVTYTTSVSSIISDTQLHWVRGKLPGVQGDVWGPSIEVVEGKLVAVHGSKVFTKTTMESQWVQLEHLPQRKERNPSIGSVRGSIVVGGGRDGTYTASATVFMWLEASSEWEEVNSLKIKRQNHATVQLHRGIL